MAHFPLSSTYVALKIHAAAVDASEELSIQQHLADNSAGNTDSSFVLLSSDSFELQGPNGKHCCFVTKPMGPSISAVLNAPFEEYNPPNPPTRRFPTSLNKRLLRNILCGLEFLHSNNVVHGDLQAGNLLFCLKPLAALDPSQLEQNMTNSTIGPLVRVDGRVDRWAPKYLAVPKPLTDEALPQDKQVVKVADFGGGKLPVALVFSVSSGGLSINSPECAPVAFWADKPPAMVVTPVALRAPETILHSTLGPPIDIWSFGCIMFELLTDKLFFEGFPLGRQDFVIDDDHLIQLSEMVDPLPEDMLAKWPRHSLYFSPHGERLNARPWDFSKPEPRRAIRPKPSNVDPPEPSPLLEDKFHEFRPTDIDDVESKEIASLLRDILQIDPLKRPSVAQLLSRPWFQI